jgi:hypothetical protein
MQTSVRNTAGPHTPRTCSGNRAILRTAGSVSPVAMVSARFERLPFSVLQSSAHIGVVDFRRWFFLKEILSVSKPSRVSAVFHTSGAHRSFAIFWKAVRATVSLLVSISVWRWSCRSFSVACHEGRTSFAEIGAGEIPGSLGGRFELLHSDVT